MDLRNFRCKWKQSFRGETIGRMRHFDVRHSGGNYIWTRNNSKHFSFIICLINVFIINMENVHETRTFYQILDSI